MNGIGLYISESKKQKTYIFLKVLENRVRALSKMLITPEQLKLQIWALGSFLDL
jgi:hypothetical protein